MAERAGFENRWAFGSRGFESRSLRYVSILLLRGMRTRAGPKATPRGFDAALSVRSVKKESLLPLGLDRLRILRNFY